MPPTPEIDLKQLQTLLREGKVQEVDNIITAAIAVAETAAAAPAPPPPAPPASPPVGSLFHELLAAVVTHLGSPPRLQTLLDQVFAELQKV